MNKKFSFVVFALLIAASMILSACQPEVITKEVEVIKEVEVVKEVEVPAEPTDKTVVEFWTTDNEEARVDVYEELAAAYMAENPDIELRIVPIDEASIAQRIATAQAANRLPDIVRMGIERVSAFAADGILDEAAAAATIAAIGEDDFRAGPLAMVTNPTSGVYSAIPFDGWIQAIWYRTDPLAGMRSTPPAMPSPAPETCSMV
jgi:multiple sugar transport system substrate-binding protein